MTGICLENRENILEYSVLGSDLIDFLDLGLKIYPIPKIIRRKMMGLTMTSFFVISFLELDRFLDPNQGDRSNPTSNPNIP